MKWSFEKRIQKYEKELKRRKNIPKPKTEMIDLDSTKDLFKDYCEFFGS